MRVRATAKTGPVAALFSVNDALNAAGGEVSLLLGAGEGVARTKRYCHPLEPWRRRLRMAVARMCRLRASDAKHALQKRYRFNSWLSNPYEGCFASY